MKRRIRLTVLTPLAIGALAVGSLVVSSGGAGAAAPAATCSASAARPDGTVSVSGKGFEPGAAVLSSPTAQGGRFEVGPDGAFTLPKRQNGAYTVSQGGRDIKCGGGDEADAHARAGGDPYKAGVVAGWDAVKGSCDASAPPSANQQFSNGWKKGAAVAREAYC
ncbi:hypothetical protein [Streptomyces sp. NPDC051000]|uniref:hypothetical protein n=1 Tax=Streptomyces sp. NPDC051000 TaxID=3155520 RepID=UPI003409BF28